MLVDRADRAERLREQLKLGAWEDGWCRSSTSGAVAAITLNVDQLATLAADGCRVEIQIEAERLRVRAIAEDSGQFVIEAAGEWADAVDDEAAAMSAADAAARHDLASVLAAMPGVRSTVTVTLLGRAAGLSWVRVGSAFVDEFSRIGWFGFAQLVAPEAGAANHVLVLDAEDAVVRAEGIAVHGPRVWPTVLPWTQDEPASLVPGDLRADVPLPSALLPVESTGEVDSVADTLRSVAGALGWLLLADSVSVSGASVVVRFAGSKQIEGPLPPCPPGAASASVGVWSWSNQSAQPARRHALVQALTLQAEEPADLCGRAASILDTAEFLFSLSQSGLVQEALAARRASRDAAVAAGRSAADRARAAARSAVDRVLVVVAAGVGVVLANKSDLIDRPVSYGLLGLAAALIIGAVLLALHFDLPGAARAVTLFKSELDQHAEVLSPRDVEVIAALPSLADGLAEVQRARRATMVILGVSLAALTLLAITVVAGQEGSATPPTPTTGPTTTTP
jgi:VCBS repeat-containing protein